MQRNTASALAVGALALAVLATSPAVAQAPGSITIRLLDAAVDRRDDPRSRIYINDHLSPGDSITRRVEVVNTTGQAQRLLFYAGAADVVGGSFTIQDGRGRNELTSWTTVEPAEAVLPHDGRQVLTVTVRIPRSADDGERYAAVLAERPPAASAPGAVSTGARVGIRMYLSVGDAEEPATDFEITTLQARRQADGRPAVTAEVTNTGGRALDLSGDLSLTEGPGGLAAGPFPAELGRTLAPGDTSPVAVVLDKAITGGPWTATLTLKSGLLERQARAQITFPDDAGEQAAPVAAENLSPAEDPKILVPIAVSLILLIALLLAWWLLARRRTRRKDDEGSQEEELVPAG